MGKPTTNHNSEYCSKTSLRFCVLLRGQVQKRPQRSHAALAHSYHSNYSRRKTAFYHTESALRCTNKREMSVL